MFTDVVGYSAMASKNEERTLRLLREQKSLVESVFFKFNGRVVKSTGDGYLVEFGSAVDAVRCSSEVQREMAKFNAGRPEDQKLLVRIGMHVGDVVHSGGDVMGDAVNVAARVQPLAEPGGICITKQVVDQVERKVDYKMVRIGMRELKNIGYPVEIYRVVVPSETGSSEVRPLDPRRLAVLPFSNMSADPNDRYFADGMTEELISTVSKIGELAVISRTSAMKYRDSSLPLGQIAQELSVGSVLEGSVRKAGNKVRITAQLIEANNDRHLWSQSYDRDLTDVFAVQADIAEQVAGSLKVQLLSREKQSIRKEATSNLDAYNLYLKGRYYWNERTEDGTKKALRYFEEAAKADPGFAMAYSGIADAYNILSDYGWMVPSEALPLAQANADKALKADSSLAEAHASLGLTLSNYKWDLNAAEKELKLAVELKPNYAPAYHWYAVVLFYMRRYDESDSVEARALALDPYSRVYRMVSTNELLMRGKYADALKRYQEMISENPNFTALRYWRSICYLLSGMVDEAVEEAREYVRMEKNVATSPYSYLHLAWVYASAGRRTEAEELLERALSERETKPVSAASIGVVMLTLGKKDEGYTWLEKGFAERDPALLYFNGFAWTKELRSDIRWAAIESRFPFKSAAD